MEDPDRVVEDPMGITTIVYKDGGCEVKDKTVWLDFSRDPSHVILVTLFPNGAPADIFIFPLK